jgi:hypothetical protein
MISKVFTDENGQSIEEIVWVNGNKLYMLTFGPDVVLSSAAVPKLKASSEVSAFSLAQELR